MKRLAVKLLKALFNQRYRAACRKPRTNTVLFLSRQSNTLSPDFKLLRDEFENVEGWDTVTCTQMLDGGLGAKISYALHMFKEVELLAQCRICFVEGYNPSLSLLDLESTELNSGTFNHTAPNKPLVFQLWHASGMYKKFGLLAVGTSEGRSQESVELFQMHRNYSWIVCSGESAREPYAAAFGYPVERTVALGRPSCDLLYEDGAPQVARVHARYPQLAEPNHKPMILFAPTLHRTQDVTSFDTLRTALEASEWASRYELVWSYHPVLTPGDTERIPTGTLLRCADLLVTDYSSIIYDAELLGVPSAFYIPDIDEYRESPGLITDPVLTSPGICLSSPEELMRFADDCLNGGTYPQKELDSFIGESLSACTPGSAKRIVEFALAKAEEA